MARYRLAIWAFYYLLRIVGATQSTHPQSSLVSSTDSNSGPTTYDQRLSIMPKPVKPLDNKIVIIDLDERSLQVEGQYPWTRIRVIFKA
jgi:CHASE2 domain-containing sensor protein